MGALHELEVAFFWGAIAFDGFVSRLDYVFHALSRDRPDIFGGYILPFSGKLNLEMPRPSDSKNDCD